MQIEILTLFPELFEPFLRSTLLGKACSRGIASITVTNFRDFAPPPHRSVDDTPYGGGPGMVLKPEPLAAAIENAKQRFPSAKVVLLTPSGVPFTQSRAVEMAKREELILICGRYEGVDQRVIELFVDEELSIGDFVLMGGEVGALAILESVVRLIPGALGNESSTEQESFSGEGLLEGPQYTKPPVFRERAVPDILLSGNHGEIAKWRHQMAIEKTARVRPDLLKR